MVKDRFVIQASTLIITVIFVTTASAELVTFTDRDAFDATGGTSSVIDFETTALDVVSSGDTISGVTFAYDFGGVSLAVDDQFDTTSGLRYLATDDGGVLQDGDDLNFSFLPAAGFGLFVVSADPLLDGDVTLTSGLVTAALEASSVQQTLADGSSVWFMGLRSDDAETITSVVLETHGGGGSFLYNVDDVVVVSAVAVPEPSSIMLLGLVTFALVRCRFRSSLKQKKDQ
ncbi:PEP-CTERM protein-sorting domain-containing protein [Neorhodopirellula lusitana]|uniref:PEP-CTERM protein-sorting domain-containing protein n=2 Tax=Neorhodopirellula lusitana TaxID=445327 RepID=A0ABY1QHY2_9BACT|nr:PEP-CTERM protein-sorting domain-containing protein [Neorhodopirellula lusitana]